MAQSSLPGGKWLVLTSEPCQPWKSTEVSVKNSVKPDKPNRRLLAPVALPLIPVVVKPVQKAHKSEVVKTSAKATADKPRLWSEVTAAAAPIAANSTQASSVSEQTIADPIPPRSLSSAAGISKLDANINIDKADTTTAALSKPESYYHDKALRTSNMMEAIYNQSLSLSDAAKKHGFASVEEAGTAMAVFGVQTKRLLRDRKLYRDTMLLAMAKDKDGYAGRSMGEMYSEAWEERRGEEVEKKKEKRQEQEKHEAGSAKGKGEQKKKMKGR